MFILTWRFAHAGIALIITYSHPDMKAPNIYRIVCMLLPLLVSACTPEPIRITQDQVCDPLAPGGQSCLPLDATHAVAVTFRDGRPHLIAMPADELLLPQQGDFLALQAQLIHRGKATRLDPAGATMTSTADGITVHSGNATPQTISARVLDEEIVLVLPGQEGPVWTILEPNEMLLPTDTVNITDTLLYIIDSLQKSTEKTYQCLLLGTVCAARSQEGIGMITFEDDIFEGFEHLTLRPTGSVWSELLKLGSDGITRRLQSEPKGKLQNLRFRTPGRDVSAAELPQTSRATARSGSTSGQQCMKFEIKNPNPLLSFKLADKRIYHSDEQNAYYIMQGSNTLHTLVLNNGCTDLCFSLDGNCIVVTGTGSCPKITPPGDCD